MIENQIIEELFISLTREWKDENGILNIGVSHDKLEKVVKKYSKDYELETLLNKLKEKIDCLGLELVDIKDNRGEKWYVIRSYYVAPTNLSREEEALLGIIISELEKSKASPKRIIFKELEKKLIKGKYFNKSKLYKILNGLIEKGYIEKKKSKIYYGTRTLLEFSEEARQHISNEVRNIIL